MIRRYAAVNPLDRILHAVMATMLFLTLGLLWWGREWFVIVVWSVLSAMGMV